MMNPQPLSLRERLAQMKSQPATGSESDTPRSGIHFNQTLPAISNGAAADGAHLESNEPANLSDDELVEAINNGDNDAA
jgi:hypothetical protein